MIDCKVSGLKNFRVSWFQGFKVLRFQSFMFQGFKGSWFQGFILHGFKVTGCQCLGGKISGFQDFKVIKLRLVFGNNR